MASPSTEQHREGRQLTLSGSQDPRERGSCLSPGLRESLPAMETPTLSLLLVGLAAPPPPSVSGV